MSNEYLDFLELYIDTLTTKKSCTKSISQIYVSLVITYQTMTPLKFQLKNSLL